MGYAGDARLRKVAFYQVSNSSSNSRRLGNRPGNPVCVWRGAVVLDSGVHHARRCQSVAGKGCGLGALPLSREEDEGVWSGCPHFLGQEDEGKGLGDARGGGWEVGGRWCGVGASWGVGGDVWEVMCGGKCGGSMGAAWWGLMGSKYDVQAHQGAAMHAAPIDEVSGGIFNHCWDGWEAFLVKWRL